MFFIYKLLLGPGFVHANLIKTQVPETVASGVQGTLRIKY